LISLDDYNNIITLATQIIYKIELLDNGILESKYKNRVKILNESKTRGGSPINMKSIMQLIYTFMLLSFLSTHSNAQNTNSILDIVGSVSDIMNYNIQKDYINELQTSLKERTAFFEITQLNDAIEFINKGGLVIIFPSGEVATSERLFNKAIEKEWKPIIGSIVRKVNCKILPVYCHGQNSFLFQLTGIINYKLRRILFAKELINKSNKKFDVECGELLDSQLFHKLENSQIAKNLRSETLKIVNLH
jgi:hypothetical protein